MQCRSVNVDGLGAIVCGSWKREQCDECGGRDVVALCDFPIEHARRKSKTCDRRMCARCQRPGLKVGEDYCSLHVRMIRLLEPPLACGCAGVKEDSDG